MLARQRSAKVWVYACAVRGGGVHGGGAVVGGHSTRGEGGRALRPDAAARRAVQARAASLWSNHDHRTEAVRIVRGPSGRPALTLARSGEPVANADVSCSACPGLVVAAFAEGARVGVDVERAGDVAIDETLVEHTTDAREWAELRSELLATGAGFGDLAVGGLTHEHVYLLAWTAKESVLKGEGLGLAAEPRDVRVRVLGPAGSSARGLGVFRGRSWSLQWFVPAPGVVGCAATSVEAGVAPIIGLEMATQPAITASTTTTRTA
ncbi:MAG: 4'-phosphopantetheinyl transferase superfamily protein [Planctomycetota bacterium]|nr:4'-phosphopantetheinyl transferase superfamily protein [Planctomycetota bacterium]